MDVIDGYNRCYKKNRVRMKKQIKLINENFDTIKAIDHIKYIHIIDKTISFLRWNKRYIISVSDSEINVWSYGYLDIAKQIGELLGIDRVVVGYTDDIRG